MKIPKRLAVYAGVLFAVAGSAVAYEQPTHFDLTRSAVEKSDLVVSDLLQVLGVPDINRQFQAAAATSDDADSPDAINDGCAHGSYLPIIKLIACGAEFEDAPEKRSVNHFFDPVNNIPLTVLGIKLGMISPDWALNDKNNATGQFYSYKDAHDAFYQALTTPGAIAATKDIPAHATRDQYWGRLFQTLGQVVHHIQDMAQPQHVRNDQHVDKPWSRIPMLYAPSHYEKYTRGLRTDLSDSNSAALQTSMRGPSAAAIYSSANPSGFSTARDFWINSSHTGMAEFSNLNFVSAGTNFQIYQGYPVTCSKYFEPLPGNPTTVPITDPSLNPPVSQQILSYCGTKSSCDMKFYPTNVGTAAENDRASTASIFDQYLNVQGYTLSNRRPDGSIVDCTSDRLFSLNKYNFATAYPLLIPRAVSYSAGLINFFFRGRLQISLADEGVYAVVDHTVVTGNDPMIGGFPAIKLNIQNITPSQEQIPDGANGTPAPGSLVAVAKFHRNTCYASDLSGEYGSPGVNWGPSNPPNLPKSNCRSQVEEIVVSDPVAVPSGINANPMPVTFKFSQKVIPISATDLFLQVVYRGPLGQEPDSVIVATKDISEPTYVFSYSRKDQYSYCHNWPVLNQGSESCPSRMFSQWCASGSFSSTDDCARAEGLTDKNQYSKDRSPVPGWDPATSSIPQGTFVDMSRKPSLTPVMTRPAPVGTLARVAVLFDAHATNAGVLVQEHVDPTHNTQNFRWFAGKAGPPTIVQLDPTTNTLNPSVIYGLARGIYLPSGEIPLASSGDAQTIPPFVLGPSQFEGAGGWYWPSN